RHIRSRAIHDLSPNLAKPYSLVPSCFTPKLLLSSTVGAPSIIREGVFLIGATISAFIGSWLTGEVMTCWRSPTLTIG
ncbi:unnamed protein product, partial [Brassica oleracea]